jgi:hypothetical protein
MYIYTACKHNGVSTTTTTKKIKTKNKIETLITVTYHRLEQFFVSVPFPPTQ